MARFRLRFLLQELDLVGSDIVIGRSPECQITIEDPLVSRQHARLQVRNDTVFISDVGSRNGVRLNGTLIRGETPLAHNDRIRLGTQDLVFLIVEESPERLSRSTGYMLHCRSCGRPFPGESAMCPHCGAAAEEDSETATNLTCEPGENWTSQLMGEVLERAMATGRVEEAERALARAVAEIERQLASQGHLPAGVLSAISVSALRVAKLSREPRWAEWVVELHRAQDLLPSADVLDALEKLDDSLASAIRPLVDSFLLRWRSRHPAPGDEERLRSRRFAAIGDAP